MSPVPYKYRPIKIEAYLKTVTVDIGNGLKVVFGTYLGRIESADTSHGALDRPQA